MLDYENSIVGWPVSDVYRSKKISLGSFRTQVLKFSLKSLHNFLVPAARFLNPVCVLVLKR